MRARSLRLFPGWTHRAVGEAALLAALDGAGAAPPVVGRAPPIAPVVGKPSQVVERPADGGVLGPQRLLPDSQAALVERLGLGEAVLGCVQRVRVVERGGDVGVLGLQRLLAGG